MELLTKFQGIWQAPNTKSVHLELLVLQLLRDNELAVLLEATNLWVAATVTQMSDTKFVGLACAKSGFEASEPDASTAVDVLQGVSKVRARAQRNEGRKEGRKEGKKEGGKEGRKEGMKE